MTNPDLLKILVKEYQEKYLQTQKYYEISLLGDVQRVKDVLIDEKFKPSLQLKNILNKQIKRAVYPMEVAIVGQFSSGKSTFLNALLSKDILPTGITPVTSKVIYINYGQEHKLRVTYTSGVHEYHPIEKISMFSDQRVGTMDDIKYLSIYAPVDILKGMSFVDTPGLNSQSEEDTQSTKKVFQDVGGIIWLTLIDNAGKRSEQEILDEHMSSFKTKSLCILNQKDKFDEKQIETTTAYVEEKFSNHFSKVIPISAKMALEARSHESAILIDDAMNGLIKDFRSGLENNPQCTTLKFFSDDFERFKKKVEKIKNLDLSTIEAEVDASNINDVLEYIEKVMRPSANSLNAFRIKNDLKNICDILINSYHTMISVYDALNTILENSKQKSMASLEKINVHYSNDLMSIYHQTERIFEMISANIYENITETIMYDFKESTSSFLHKEKIEKYAYKTFKLDSNKTMNKLFYNDTSVETMTTEVLKFLNIFEENTHEAIEEIYSAFEDEVMSWQNKYLLLSKNREISSDLEFSKVKRFASKVHENILRSFHTATLGHMETLNKQNAYLHGSFSYNFMQTVQVTLSEIEEKILESEVIYKKDPTKFSVYKPSQEDVLHRLKMNFNFEKLEDFLMSIFNYLSKVIKDAKKDFLEIAEQKMNFVSTQKVPFLEKIDDLKTIKVSIVHETEKEDIY